MSDLETTQELITSDWVTELETLEGDVKTMLSWGGGHARVSASYFFKIPSLRVPLKPTDPNKPVVQLRKLVCQLKKRGPQDLYLFIHCSPCNSKHWMVIKLEVMRQLTACDIVLPALYFKRVEREKSLSDCQHLITKLEISV